MKALITFFRRVKVKHGLLSSTYWKSIADYILSASKYPERYVGPLFTRSAFVKGIGDESSAPRKFRLFEDAAKIPWDERGEDHRKFPKEPGRNSGPGPEQAQTFDNFKCSD